MPDVERIGGIYIPSDSSGALRQTEIISDLLQAKLTLESLAPGLEQRSFDFARHPFAMVVSQDCDLEQDVKARQNGPGSLPNILLCEVHEAARVQEDLRQRKLGDIWKRIKRNHDERYQFLQAVRPDQDALGEGLPELAIDFKRYFTIPTDELYQRLTMPASARRRCRLESPYLQHLSRRFFNFQSRVALPEDAI